MATLKRNREQELLARTFFRAVRETKNIDTATMIVSGDYIEGEDTREKLYNALDMYVLSYSEGVYLMNLLGLKVVA